MNSYVMYLIVTSLCLLITYGFFKLFVENRVTFAFMRFFLLATVVFSLLLPFHSYRIDLGFGSSSETVQETEEALLSGNTDIGSHISGSTEQTSDTKLVSTNRLSSWMLIKYIYFIVMGLLFMRLIMNLFRIMYLRIIHNSQKQAGNRIILTNRISNSFSFFGWIFLNRDEKSDAEIQNIIIHEKIHASQYHSIDLLLIEVLIAVMWFNPVVWLMRKMLQQIHEYLADEGALNTGVSKPVYKAHLLNQVAEERLIVLSSGFNHSLIKKRIVMMTKPKFGQKTNFRFLTIIPLTLLLFAAIACLNGQQNEGEKKTVAAVAPTKMNVLYLGVDNPMSIAVSGYEADELTVEVDAGKILGENGQYIIRPNNPGTLKIFVYAGEELVSETHFRVKTVPDPVAKLAGKKGGVISKSELLKAGKVYVEMENFDFDLSFEIVSFVMSATVPGSYTVREEISHSGEFSETQIDLINSMIENQKLMIEEVKAKGPDGAIRKLGSLVFSIS